MADSKIVKYIKDTLSEGYSQEQVREALIRQGWYKEEIDEAFSVAVSGEKKPQVQQEKTGPGGTPPAEEKEKARRLSSGFLLGVAGGSLIILNAVLLMAGMGDILSFFITDMGDLSISFLEMFDVTLSLFDSFLINLIIGGFLIGSAYIVYLMPDRSKITGMFMVALSLISLMVGNGFLIGGIIAVAAGVFVVLGR